MDISVSQKNDNMKKLITLLVALVTFHLVQAQSYSFESEQKPYVELQNDILLFDDTGAFKLVPVFPIFRSFGHDFSDTLEIGYEGWMSKTKDRGFWFLPIYGEYRFPDADSKVSYAIDETPGNRILKIQWKQLAIDTDLDTRVNFQLWIYEKDQTVEFRYGKGSLPGEYAIGIYLFNRNYSNVQESIEVKGHAGSVTTSMDSIGFYNGFPNENDLYRFRYLNVGMDELIDGQQLSIYPNPSNGSFRFTQEEVEIIKITDVIGREIAFQQEGSLIIFDQTTTGVYFVQTKNKQGAISVIKLQLAG